MAIQTTNPKGEALEVEMAYVKGVKADFVNKSVTISLTMALDETVLGLRDKLAFLSFDEQPVRLTIQPLQMQLINTDSLPLERS